MWLRAFHFGFHSPCCVVIAHRSVDPLHGWLFCTQLSVAARAVFLSQCLLAVGRLVSFRHAIQHLLNILTLLTQFTQSKEKDTTYLNCMSVTVKRRKKMPVYNIITRRCKVVPTYVSDFVFVFIFFSF